MRDSDTTTEEHSYQPTLSRRGFLRAAAVGTGAAAVGTGGIATQTQRAQAIGPAILLAYPAATTIATLATATVVGQHFLGGGESVDPQEVNDTAVAQSTWEISTSVSEGRSTFIEELRHEYGIGEEVDALSTSHGAAMWSALETSVARSRVDGDTKTAAVDDARDALNQYAGNSVWNNIDRWNKFWTAMGPAVGKSISGEGVVTPANGAFTALEDSSQTAIDPAAVEPLVEIDGKTYVWADSLDGPNVDLPNWLDLTAVAGENSDVNADDLYVTRVVVDGSVVDILDPTTSTVINATHPDYGTQTLADAGLYATLVDITRTLRNDLSAGLTDTVDAIYEQFDIGERSPSDIISAQGMLQEFDGGDQLTEQEAVAGLVARGYALPSDLQNPVTVNHPDLEGETSGWLFVDSPKTLKLTGGTTVPSSDYEMAYIVYDSAVDGATKTAMLSGTSDLQIVEYAGEKRTQLDFREEDTATYERYIYILEDHDKLSPDAAATLQVSDSEGSATYAASLLESPGTDAPSGTVYQLPIDSGDGGLDGTSGTPIESVELVEGLTIEDRSTSFVSDPTSPTKSNERVDQMLAEWEEIREQLDGLDGAGGGGGSSDDGLGLGSIAALVAGGGILAYILNGGGGR
ncbi:twin-arginine translocation signal domain-containing protein [Haloferax larsenii]|uniref:Tat (Twin-arginine translocation) pathway signal sequence n=1 Tax=Haloferax larsenii TaxID=302484 RepID=A0A1H7J6X5_HALLR|nr:twin-arginine translocation signal domain-containing protein [Haloferax larsenii]SEK70491.1 Tat (twin-arginine translocation) pathway signal sequence [Haloferax larsenii]